MKPGFPKDYRGQFEIAEVVPTTGTPANARLQATRSLRVSLHPGIDAMSVEDSQGTVIGLILGHPISSASRTMHEGRLRLSAPCPRTAPEIEAFIEAQIYALAGPFLFILDLPGLRRVYLDACGSLSAVYDPLARRVAATSLLLLDPDSAGRRFRADMYARLGVIREGWFLGGLTAHEGIFRLMPNFFLDFDTFEAHRHWPVASIAPSPDPRAACAVIATNARDTIAATLARGGINMALTSGNETRLLLAAAREMRDDLHFFTVSTPTTRLDVHTATTLAARHGLDHRLLPEVQADTDGQIDWHARTGHTYGGLHVKTHPTTRQLENRPFFVGGLGGEIGRGFFWRGGDTDATRLTARDIWARTGMPADDTGIAAIEQWLGGVAHLPGLLQLDLAYLELRMGCWGFAMAYANHTPVHIHPLISRTCFTAMLSLPPDWRRQENGSNRWIREVIRQNWPELLDLPINRYGDYRDRLRLLERALRAPHLIPKKLRKMFG